MGVTILGHVLVLLTFVFWIVGLTGGCVALAGIRRRDKKKALNQGSPDHPVGPPPRRGMAWAAIALGLLLGLLPFGVVALLALMLHRY
ncbi:MAG: hypothetical protein HY000_38640 [Planctomycetes bacterium]|nr:hypothetical protein [Planctomycetota bacterium]